MVEGVMADVSNEPESEPVQLLKDSLYVETPQSTVEEEKVARDSLSLADKNRRLLRKTRSQRTCLVLSAHRPILVNTIA